MDKQITDPLPQGRVRVLEILEATTGGTRRHMQLLLRNLDQRRFAVTLAYANRRDSHFANDLREYRTMRIELVEIQMRREIHPASDLLALIRLIRLIRRGRFDVVHAHSSKAGFLGRLAARLAGVGATIYTPHGFAFQYKPQSLGGRLYRALERLGGRWTDLLLCVSEGERRLAIEHGLTSAPIEVIPNAIPIPKAKDPAARERVRRQYGIPMNSLVVGTVAQFRPQKGYRHFIEAIPQVLRTCPDTWFLIVGDGDERPKVEQTIRNLNIGQPGHPRRPPGRPRRFLLRHGRLRPKLPLGRHALRPPGSHGRKPPSHRLQHPRQTGSWSATGKMDSWLCRNRVNP